MSYYAVAKGRRPGIYRTWPECQQEVKGFSGAVYQKFKSLSDAEAFVVEGSSREKAPKEGTQAEMPVLPTDAKIVYTDGSCRMLKSGRKAGYGYYIPVLNRKCSGPITPPLTNNRAELTAILLAVREFPPGERIHIVTDSKYAILIFTGTGRRYAQNNYREGGEEVKNRDLIEQAVEASEQYSLSFTHVFSHTGLPDELSRGNQIADQLSRGGT